MITNYFPHVLFYRAINKNLILILLVLTSFVFPVNTKAQTPKKMSYQALIRDANNNLLSEQNIGVQISILKDSATGDVVFVEQHNLDTNVNGLVSLQIGSGTTSVGSLNNIDWTTGSYFIKIETDPNGGNNYTLEGTSQLLSVPFAFYADSSGHVNEIITTLEKNEDGTYTYTSENNTQTTFVGTDDQNLTLNANSLEIEDGNSVDLSTYLDNTDEQNISGSGLNGTMLTIGIENGNAETVDLAPLQDGTGTDDQNLTLNANSLEIEDGNSVDLSTYLDNTDDQTLSLTGNSLEIEDGNSVDLSVYNQWAEDNNGIQDLIYATKAKTAGADIVITDDGKIGIGTDSPSEKLEVEGNIKASGSLQLGTTSGINIGDSCTSAEAGTIIFNGTHFCACDGAKWNQVD